MKEKIFRFCAVFLIPLMAVLNCPVGPSSANADTAPVTTEIEHSPVGEVVAGKRIPLEVEVEDEAGVKVVRIYFKASEAADYSFVALQAIDDETYSGVLPAPANGAGTIEYLILVQNGNNQVVKSQTYVVTVEDDDDAAAAVAENNPIQVYTELEQAPMEITGFSDNIVVDVVESAAKLGVVAGLYSMAKAGSSSSGAVAAGTVTASSGISTTAVVLGAVAAAAVAGGVAAAAVASSDDDDDSGGNVITGTCNATATSGSDAPETHNISLGKSSGTFGFSWDMVGIPDRMVVSVAGRALFDTGCVSGSGSRNISFSGGSTATVSVTPNCAGNTSGTYWQFNVGCP